MRLKVWVVKGAGLELIVEADWLDIFGCGLGAYCSVLDGMKEDVESVERRVVYQDSRTSRLDKEDGER